MTRDVGSSEDEKSIDDVLIEKESVEKDLRFYPNKENTQQIMAYQKENLSKEFLLKKMYQWE